MICSYCKHEYDNSTDPKCPKCNRTNYSGLAMGKINLENELSFKGKSNIRINKRPSFEFKGCNEVNYHLNRKVIRTYRVDRVNDRYIEKITDKVTGEIILDVDEPLSEHINHGDAKKITEKIVLK